MTPRARKRIDSAVARAAPTPLAPNSVTNATCVVPKPLMVIGICMTSRMTGMKAK